MSKKKDTESADPTESTGSASDSTSDGAADGTSSGSAGESGSGSRSGAKSAGGRQRRSRRKTAAAGGRSGESRSAKRAGADDEAPAASKDAKDTETGRGEAAEATSAEERSAEGSARAGSSTGEPGETGETAAEASTPRRAGTEEGAAETPAESPAETPDAGAPDEAAAGPDTGPEADKGFAATRADELAYHEATMDELAGEAAEERGYRTVWATLFFILLGAIAVAGLTLWGAPKVAPHLPAAVAQYLMPGQLETAERLAALEDRLAGRAEATDTALAEIRGRLDSLAAEVESAAESAAAAEDTGAAIAELRQTAEGAAQDTRALAERVDTVQSQLAAAREELAAVSDTLTGGGEGTAPPELAAALAALRSRVDRLAATLEEGPSTAGLAERLDTLSSRVAELEGSIAEAREAGSEASGAIRQARLQSALDTLASRLAAGQPYDTPLGEAAELGEVAPPEALAAGAGSGLATAAELEASFGRHAQEAIAADIRARSGDGAVGQAFGWLRAQVAGRPVSEQEGDSVAAVTSRIAARLEEGRLAEALAEAEALPEPARAGLGRWLEQLRARVAAERALTEWRDQITARG